MGTNTKIYCPPIFNNNLNNTLLFIKKNNDKIGTIDPNGTNVPVQLSSTLLKQQ